MLFGTIRVLFWGFIFIIVFFLIRKSNIVNKLKWTIVSFVVAIILVTISGLIPIENAIVTFSSPEAAYNYKNSGEVKLVVEGEQTDFVIGVKGNKRVFNIIPKTDKGWKVSGGFNSKIVARSLSDGISIVVYQYRNSDDYYIAITDTNGGKSDISDNKNSEFYYLEKYNSTLDKTFYTYYAYINDFDDQYTITVNEKIITVQ